MKLPFMWRSTASKIVLRQTQIVRDHLTEQITTLQQTIDAQAGEVESTRLLVQTYIDRHSLAMRVLSGQEGLMTEDQAIHRAEQIRRLFPVHPDRPADQWGVPYAED